MKKKEAIADKVKRKLWTFGYSVKDYSGKERIPFDLLVENNIRVIVGSRKLKTCPRICDVYAYVEEGLIYYTNKTESGLTSPYSAFGKKVEPKKS